MKEDEYVYVVFPWPYDTEIQVYSTLGAAQIAAEANPRTISPPGGCGTIIRSIVRYAHSCPHCGRSWSQR